MYEVNFYILDILNCFLKRTTDKRNYLGFYRRKITSLVSDWEKVTKINSLLRRVASCTSWTILIDSKIMCRLSHNVDGSSAFHTRVVSIYGYILLLLHFG